MHEKEYIELFFSRSYEKDIDKLIRDDKDYVIPYEKLHDYVHNIITIPYQSFISFICSHPLKEKIENKDITQSSSFTACEIEMCNALLSVDNPGLNFIEIGKLFTQYISHPNDSAFRKYGENQIKTSAHLGLVYEYYKYWYLSCLGYIYPGLSEVDRMKLLARTILRTPLYYRMMVDLYYQNIESTKYMNTLSRATQQRREGSVCRLIEICLNECYRTGIHMHRLTRTSIEPRHNVVYDLFSTAKIEEAAAEEEKESRDDKKKVPSNKNTENTNLNEGESEEDNAFQIISHVEQDNDIEYQEDEISESFRLFLANVQKSDLLTEKEIHVLLRKYRDGDKKAYEKLIEGHLRHVVAVARLFLNTGIPFEDIIQEGIMGLLEAIKRFDYQRSRNFTYFAKIGIYRYLDISLRNAQCQVKIAPRHLYYHKLVRQFCDDYIQREEMEPPFEYVEFKEEVSPDFLKPIYNLPSDLQEAVIAKNDWDEVADDTFLADKQMMADSSKFDLLRYVHSLPPRMCYILESFYGLNGKPEESLEKIGERFHLTRERVRQIKEKGVRIIKDLVGIRTGQKKTDEPKKVRKTNLIGNQFNALVATNTNAITTTKQQEEPDLTLKAIVKSAPASHPTIEEKKKEPPKETPSSIIDPNELKKCVLQVLRAYKRPMTLGKIAYSINKLPLNYAVQPMSVKYVLMKLEEVAYSQDGHYYLKEHNDLFPERKKIIEEAPSPINTEATSPIQTEAIKNEDKAPQELNNVSNDNKGSIAQTHSSSNQSIQTATTVPYETNKRSGTDFRLSSSLWQLVDLNILTRKEFKHCQKKKLKNIGDVKKMIDYYHLTPDSTRFTQYTLDIWFRIVGLLESNHQAESTKTIKEASAQKPNDALEKLYADYSYKVLRIRQAHINGKASPAKPILLLSVIDGIENGQIKYNRIFLNWDLVNHYKKLMQEYLHSETFTPINYPFWHMQNDGFWHLYLQKEVRLFVAPSTNWLMNNVRYASFDNDLWMLLQNQEMRHRLRNDIIKNKLT